LALALPRADIITTLKLDIRADIKTAVW